MKLLSNQQKCLFRDIQCYLVEVGVTKVDIAPDRDVPAGAGLSHQDEGFLSLSDELTLLYQEEWI